MRNVTLLVLASPHLHGDDRSGYELSVVPDGEVPRPDPHQVVEIELHYQSSFSVDLERGNEGRL